MDEDMLRPIGTVFEYEFPPDPKSSNFRFRIYKYRVVAHSETTSGLAETVEAIDVRYDPVIGVSINKLPPRIYERG